MIRFILPDLRRIENTIAGALVLFRFSEKVPFRGITSLVDWRLHGHLSKTTINGFFTGAPEDPLLMPLGRFLPQPFLLLMGLGPRDRFSETVFEQSLLQTFDILRGLKVSDIVLALPGRVEETCQASDAIEWFIRIYDTAPDLGVVHIVEPAEAQKSMAPAVERWRLRSLVSERS